MKLEEMRKIAEAKAEKITLEKLDDEWTKVHGIRHRRGDSHHVMLKEEAEFIALAANTYDILIEIAEAAKKHIPSERNYCAKELNRLVGYDVYGELKDALKKLEEI